MSVFFESKEVQIEVDVRRQLEFPPHFHSQIELVIMRRGSTRAFLNFKEYEMEAGDVFIAFPNQIHHYRDEGEHDSLLIIFPGELCSEFSPLFPAFVPASPLVKGLGNDPALQRVLDEMLDCRRRRPPYFEAMTKGYLILFIAELLPRLGLTPVRRDDSDLLRTILNYCSDHYHAPLKLDDLAQALHVSKFHISHLLNEKLQMGLNEYVNRLRIAEACDRLRNSDASVTEIAEAVGFNSLRSFNRVFQAERGTTPLHYRRIKIE